MHGIYVRGWKFDWAECKRETDELLAAGREMAAAAIADPGCCSCQTCGEHHWREFEVFLCCRCGAECVINNQTFDCESGPAAKPEMVRPRLRPGLRVKFLGTAVQQKNKITGEWETYRHPGNWPAGRILSGWIGTIVYRVHYWDSEKQRCTREPVGPPFEGWEIDFDNTRPKPGYIFGAGFGPFLSDEFEIV